MGGRRFKRNCICLVIILYTKVGVCCAQREFCSKYVAQMYYQTIESLQMFIKSVVVRAQPTCPPRLKFSESVIVRRQLTCTPRLLRVYECLERVLQYKTYLTCPLKLYNIGRVLCYVGLPNCLSIICYEFSDWYHMHMEQMIKCIA